VQLLRPLHRTRISKLTTLTGDSGAVKLIIYLFIYLFIYLTRQMAANSKIHNTHIMWATYDAYVTWRPPTKDPSSQVWLLFWTPVVAVHVHICRSDFSALVYQLNAEMYITGVQRMHHPTTKQRQ